MRTHEFPGAHIFWLLLKPDDAGERWIATQDLPEGGAGKRVQLLDAANSDVARRPPDGGCSPGPRRPCRCTAQPCDGRGPLPRLGVVDHRQKAAPCQVEGCGTHGGMPQQALRCQHEQRKRIAREQMSLPSKQMEILRRGRTVDQAEVDVSRGLKDALGSTRSSDPVPGLHRRVVTETRARVSDPTSLDSR